MDQSSTLTATCKTNLYQASRFPFQLPKFHLGPYYTMKAAGKRPSTGFIRVRVDGGESGATMAAAAAAAGQRIPFLIQTNVFYTPNGPLHHTDGSISFGLRKEDSPNLHELINAVENMIEAQLRLGSGIEALPDKTAEKLRDAKGPVVRPFCKDQQRIYVQPAADCVTYNWLGSDLSQEDWRGGKYQLILRLTNIFLGQKGHAYPAYLQWKICQVRYFPESRQVSQQPLGFLFTKDDDSAAAGAAPSAKQQQQPGPAFNFDDIFRDEEEYEPFIVPMEQGNNSSSRTTPPPPAPGATPKRKRPAKLIRE